MSKPPNAPAPSPWSTLGLTCHPPPRELHAARLWPEVPPTPAVPRGGPPPRSAARGGDPARARSAGLAPRPGRIREGRPFPLGLGSEGEEEGVPLLTCVAAAIGTGAGGGPADPRSWPQSADRHAPPLRRHGGRRARGSAPPKAPGGCPRCTRATAAAGRGAWPGARVERAGPTPPASRTSRRTGRASRAPAPSTGDGPTARSPVTVSEAGSPAPASAHWPRAGGARAQSLLGKVVPRACPLRYPWQRPSVTAWDARKRSGAGAASPGSLLGGLRAARL